MDTIQTLTTEAAVFKKSGELDRALETYSKAFDMLIDAAGVYALEQESSVTDMAELRNLAPALFEHSKVFLRRTLDASSILNQMGLLFLELGDFENARQKLLEAIEFIPLNMVYDEPAKNLELVFTTQQRVLSTLQQDEETI